jgi:hypothetical protein
MNDFLSGNIGRCLGAVDTSPLYPTTSYPTYKPIVPVATAPAPTTTTANKLSVDQILQYGQQAVDIYNTYKNPATGQPTIILPPSEPVQPNYTKIALIGVAGLLVVGGIIYAMKGKKKGLGCPDGVGCPDAPGAAMLNGPKKRKRKK